MDVRRLIWVKLKIPTFIFTLTDNHLHELVNLDSVSIHSKNMTREYGWPDVAKRLLTACLKSLTAVLFSRLSVWFETSLS